MPATLQPISCLCHSNRYPKHDNPIISLLAVFLINDNILAVHVPQKHDIKRLQQQIMIETEIFSQVTTNHKLSSKVLKS